MPAPRHVASHPTTLCPSVCLALHVHGPSGYVPSVCMSLHVYVPSPPSVYPSRVYVPLDHCSITYRFPLCVYYVSPYLSPSYVCTAMHMFPWCVRPSVYVPPCVCLLHICAPPNVFPIRVCVPSYDCSFTCMFPPCVCPPVRISPPFTCPVRTYVPSVYMSRQCACPSVCMSPMESVCMYLTVLLVA